MLTRNLICIAVLGGALCCAAGGALTQNADAKPHVPLQKTIGVVTPTGPVPSLFVVNSTGDANSNLKLSLERAEAIKEAQSTTFAVSPDRLFAIGVGEEMPIDAAHPEAAMNRRVQLIYIGLAK